MTRNHPPPPSRVKWSAPNVLFFFITDASLWPSDEEHEKGVTATNLVYRVDCSSEPPALKLRDDVSGRVLSESFMDNSQVRFIRYNLTPFSRIRIFLKVEIFFSVLVFCLPSTHKRRFRAPKTQVFENGLQSGV